MSAANLLGVKFQNYLLLVVELLYTFVDSMKRRTNGVVGEHACKKYTGM